MQVYRVDLLLGAVTETIGVFFDEADMNMVLDKRYDYRITEVEVPDA